MKKILITIMIFLVTITGYAGIYRSESANDGQYGGGLYENSYNTSVGENSGYGGIYRSSADDPGDRPGSGGGIGQNAPLGDGVRSIVVCCLIYGLVKIINKKRNDKS